ncbi:hypothetical protein EKG38_02460 [Shewanella canadensis]|uniref:Uncharacterized protein n=1 Tax=Shewanella canadensis TaxID=271096 RepID=A0A3S0KXI8_9GAMM|nr:hypothetical protein [Shewanella canadensis]RTR40794.1 hypothetical protein EKG38_02460 [Shewanella canadensis]
MEVAKIILEYVKVVLSFPVATVVLGIAILIMFRDSVSTLLANVAKAKLPGGIELETHQNVRSSQIGESKKLPDSSDSTVDGLPSGLNDAQKTQIEDLVKSHIASTYLWEYRYLNFYFVRGTQLVLDWFVSLNQATTLSHFDTVWMSVIPSVNERQAIITSLQNHHLINLDESSGTITVNPKGKEYQQWRGPVPPLTN